MATEGNILYGTQLRGRIDAWTRPPCGGPILAPHVSVRMFIGPIYLVVRSLSRSYLVDVVGRQPQRDDRRLRYLELCEEDGGRDVRESVHRHEPLEFLRRPLLSRARGGGAEQPRELTRPEVGNG